MPAASAEAVDAAAPQGRKERALRELGKPRRTRFPTAPTAEIFLLIKINTKRPVPGSAHHRVSRIRQVSMVVDSLDAKAVASLAGLAPVTRESGTWAGRSFIQGGRARARRLLYMPALAAICYNPDLSAKYRQFVAQGKPRKVAVVAVMRKLLVLANALLGEDRCWVPERPGRDSAAAPAVAMPFAKG